MHIKLFIIILLINYSRIFGRIESKAFYLALNLILIRLNGQQEKIYKVQLREMYKQKVEQTIIETLQGKFLTIYNNILDLATNGVNEYGFTIMCEQTNYENNMFCENYNGYKRWIQNHPKNIVSKSYITREDFTTTIIDMLNYTFPDSKISKLHKYCCDYYQIEW